MKRDCWSKRLKKRVNCKRQAAGKAGARARAAHGPYFRRGTFVTAKSPFKRVRKYDPAKRRERIQFNTRYEQILKGASEAGHRALLDYDAMYKQRGFGCPSGTGKATVVISKTQGPKGRPVDTNFTRWLRTHKFVNRGWRGYYTIPMKHPCGLAHAEVRCRAFANAMNRLTGGNIAECKVKK